MRVILLAILSTLLHLSALASSFTPEERELLSSANPDELALVAALVDDFSQATNIIQVPFSVYYYVPIERTNLNKSTQVKEDNLSGYEYAKERMETFWQVTDRSSDKSNRFSIDPVCSRDKGGKDFLLLQVQLKKGLSVLDLPGVTFSSSNGLLSKFGCDTDFWSNSGKCAQYIKLAYKALQLSGVKVDDYETRKCESQGFAFVLTSPALIGRDAIHSLTSDANLADSKTRSLARNIYLIAKFRSKKLDLFKQWDSQFDQIKLSDTDLTRILNQDLVTSQGLEAHFRPQFDFNSSQKVLMNRLAGTETGELEVAKKASADAVYHGKPMIAVGQILWSNSSGADRARTKRRMISLLDSLTQFCGGLGSCSYLTQGYSERISLRWNCFDGSTNVPYARDFDLTKNQVIYLSCSRKN